MPIHPYQNKITDSWQVTADEFAGIVTWCHPDEVNLTAHTLVIGDTQAGVGDYVVKDINGDFFILDDKGFDKIYDLSAGRLSYKTSSLNFGHGNMIAYATISDTTMTETKIIAPFYSDKKEEVAVLGLTVSERSRTPGVGYEIIGVAINGANGVYPVRITTQGE